MTRKRQQSAMGIDPSVTATGIAVESEGFSFRHTSPLKAKKLKGDYRLIGLFDEITYTIGWVDMMGFPVKLAIMEDLPTHAKSAGLTGRAQGAVRMALSEAGVPYMSLPPATLKKAATGKGNADKAAMRAALPQAYSDVLADDNQVDAFWLAEIAKHYMGEPADLLAMPEWLPELHIEGGE